MYDLADRSNAGVEVVNAKTSTFVKKLSANPPFAGLKLKPNPSGPGEVANNDISGPNGVVVAGR